MRSGSKVSGKELLQSPERHGLARPDRGRAGRRVTKLLCNDGKQNPDNSCSRDVPASDGAVRRDGASRVGVVRPERLLQVGLGREDGA